MKVARASTQEQLLLFDLQPQFPIPTNAHARNAYGTAAQHIVCGALGLRPIRIDGRYDVCFDAELASTFYEIKSVHHNGKLVIYDWRLAKEIATEIEAGMGVRYAILEHHVRGARSSLAMWKAFQSGGLNIVLVSLATVHAAAMCEPLRTIRGFGDVVEGVEGEPVGSPRAGYNRRGYRDGYRNVPLAAVRGAATHVWEHTFDLYDLTYRVTIHEEPASTCPTPTSPACPPAALNS